MVSHAHGNVNFVETDKIGPKKDKIFKVAMKAIFKSGLLPSFCCLNQIKSYQIMILMPFCIEI